MPNIQHPASWIHPAWYEPFDPDAWRMKKAWLGEKASKHGLEPRECRACHDMFMPTTPQQVHCDTEQCRTAYQKVRNRERRKLAAMLANAKNESKP